MEDDFKSMVSVQSRRHSIAGSVVRDDESLASSTAVPSYMVPTQPTKVWARPRNLELQFLICLDFGFFGIAGHLL